ncbi:ATP-dependent DNA helicase PIF1, partial [Paramuricea clavata]
EQNVAIDYLFREENDIKLNALISIIWIHVFKLIGDHIVQNADEITFNLGRQHFTDAVAELYEFYIGTNFSNYVNAIFACDQPTAAQRAVIIQLSNQVFEEFLEYATLSTVCTKQECCDLLEENVITPFAKLEQSSLYAETLQITEGRQYRERGLLHITDNTYHFFMILEQKRVELLNINRLHQENKEMVSKAIAVIDKDTSIRRCWLNCFSHTCVENQLNRIEMMLKRILFHYVNMGTNQFSRDFRLAYKVKKTAELHKKVQQKRKNNMKKLKVCHFWGSEFRNDYGKLGVLCAFFPDILAVAITATASSSDVVKIKESLGLKKCNYIIGNPDSKYLL